MKILLVNDCSSLFFFLEHTHNQKKHPSTPHKTHSKSNCNTQSERVEYKQKNPFQIQLFKFTNSCFSCLHRFHFIQIGKKIHLSFRSFSPITSLNQSPIPHLLVIFLFIFAVAYAFVLVRNLIPLVQEAHCPWSVLELKPKSNSYSDQNYVVLLIWAHHARCTQVHGIN